jgi:nitrogen fixation protein FixH
VGADARRFEPWPFALIGALGFMIAVSIAFLRVAVGNPDPLVVKDAYAAEPAVAEAMRARARAAEQGWKLSVRTRAETDGVVVEAALRDGHGDLLDVERVVVRRERPAEGGLDLESTLVREGDLYVGHVSLPRAGRWQLVVRAERGGALLEETLALWGPG